MRLLRALGWLHWGLEVAACLAALLLGTAAAVVLVVLGEGHQALIAAAVAAGGLVYGVVVVRARPWSDEDL